MRWCCAGVVLVVTMVASGTAGQTLPGAAAEWAVDVGDAFDVDTDVTYLRASGQELKLDVYTPRGRTQPNATVIAFHGGGWVAGEKQSLLLHLLPYLEAGFSVVNVEYRLASVAPAPAAVEDCRCAVRWVVEHAPRYRFDPERLIVTGASAGGHLALTTAFLPAAAGFDRPCPAPAAERWGVATPRELRVAAVVNWFGVTDVAELIDGPRAHGYALEWLGSRADRRELARRLSPLDYVRPDLPPVLTIHGERDDIVPYDQATRLHAALDAARVPNRLVSVPGAGHGDFSRAERRRAFAAVRAFLDERRLSPARP